MRILITIGLSVLSMSGLATAAAPRRTTVAPVRAARPAPGGAWSKAIVGQEAFKSQMEQWEHYAGSLRRTSSASPKARCVVTGDPAVGKTTMVKAMAKRFKAMGLVATDEFRILSMRDLIAPFQEQSFQKASEVLARHRDVTVEIEEVRPFSEGYTSREFAAVLEAIRQHPGPVVLTAYNQEDLRGGPALIKDPVLKGTLARLQDEFPREGRFELKQPSPSELAARVEQRVSRRDGSGVSHAAERRIVKAVDGLGGARHGAAAAAYFLGDEIVHQAIQRNRAKGTRNDSLKITVTDVDRAARTLSERRP